MTDNLIECPFEKWTTEKKSSHFYSPIGADFFIVKDASGNRRLLFHKVFSEASTEFSALRAAGWSSQEITDMIREDAEILYEAINGTYYSTQFQPLDVRNRLAPVENNIANIYEVKKTDNGNTIHIFALTDIPSFPEYNDPESFKKDFPEFCNGLSSLLKSDVHMSTFSSANLIWYSEPNGKTVDPFDFTKYEKIPKISCIGIACQSIQNDEDPVDLTDRNSEQSSLTRLLAKAASELYHCDDALSVYLKKVAAGEEIPADLEDLSKNVIKKANGAEIEFDFSSYINKSDDTKVKKNQIRKLKRINHQKKQRQLLHH